MSNWFDEKTFSHTIRFNMIKLPTLQFCSVTNSSTVTLWYSDVFGILQHEGFTGSRTNSCEFSAFTVPPFMVLAIEASTVTLFKV